MVLLTHSKVSIKRAREDLVENYNAYIVNSVNRAIPEAGAKTRSALNSGKSGTLKHLLVGNATQLMAHPTTAVGIMVNDIRALSGMADASVSDYFKAGKSYLPTIGIYTAMATALGVASTMALDFVKGKEVRDPTHLETWRDGFIRAGAAGPMTHFMVGQVGEQYGSGAITGMLGPAWKDADDFWNLMNNTKPWGDSYDNKAHDWLKFMYNHLPGTWYTNAIIEQGMKIPTLNKLDALEALKPGQRARRKAYRSKMIAEERDMF